MNLQELHDLLGTTGLPVAYNVFAAPQQLPYICYLVPYSNNFGADGVVYHRIDHVQIELYTRGKEPGTEQLLERVLDGAGLFWEKEEDYIDSERCYQILYEVEV